MVFLHGVLLLECRRVSCIVAARSAALSEHSSQASLRHIHESAGAQSVGGNRQGVTEGAHPLPWTPFGGICGIVTTLTNNEQVAWGSRSYRKRQVLACRTISQVSAARQPHATHHTPQAGDYISARLSKRFRRIVCCGQRTVLLNMQAREKAARQLTFFVSQTYRT